MPDDRPKNAAERRFLVFLEHFRVYYMLKRGGYDIKADPDTFRSLAKMFLAELENCYPPVLPENYERLLSMLAKEYPRLIDISEIQSFVYSKRAASRPHTKDPIAEEMTYEEKRRSWLAGKYVVYCLKTKDRMSSEGLTEFVDQHWNDPRVQSGDMSSIAEIIEGKTAEDNKPQEKTTR